MPRILITGAAGRVGKELTVALRKTYGDSNILATDIIEPLGSPVMNGPFELLDALNGNEMLKVIRANDITQVYHLSAMLSTAGENDPMKGWDLNMQSLLSLLEIAKDEGLERVFWPSSIAVFGKGARKIKCGQFELQQPSTVYGISKSAGELWCNYYYEKYSVDVRSLRYPALISIRSSARGGITDFVIDMFHKAIKEKQYTCYLKENTRLPMMHMRDAIRASIELMETKAESLRVRTSYNLSGMDFTPAEIAQSIKERVHQFSVSYEPDYRQRIADSWPASMDDYHARRDWNWKPEYNLNAMTKEMLLHINAKYLNELQQQS